MKKKRVALITGITGGLARKLGVQLARRGFEIVGVDYRTLQRTFPYKLEFYRANYNKTLIEDVFRRHRPSHVFHLGRVGNLKEHMGKRFDLNVMGSQKVMDLSVKYEVGRLVVLSTHHIYGADPRNHIPIYEEEPLRAGGEFPQIADAIQLDNLAMTWIYRYPEVRTLLLRPCNVVGPSIHNTINRVLRLPMIPVPMGFSPMMQFIHEDDMISAILAGIENDAAGVFNVAGRSPIPFLQAVEFTRSRPLLLPSSLVGLALRTNRRTRDAFPAYLINFLKYPCVLGDQAFRKTFDWAPSLDEKETITSSIKASPHP